MYSFEFDIQEGMQKFGSQYKKLESVGSEG